MDNEAFYDEEIAPALAEMSKRLNERGMSFLALVAYNDKGEVGHTYQQAAGAPMAIRYPHMLAQCWCEGGSLNFDGFMIAVMRDQDGKPHNSAILARLGVKPAPAAPAE